MGLSSTNVLFEGSGDNLPVGTEAQDLATTPSLAKGTYVLIGKARFHNNGAEAQVTCNFAGQTPVAGSTAVTTVAGDKDGEVLLLSPLTVGTEGEFSVQCAATSTEPVAVTAFHVTVLAVQVSKIIP